MPGNTLSHFKPPGDVAKAAAEGLKLRSRFHRGGTAVGIARGKQLSRQGPVSPEVIKRMYSYFARHEVDKKGKNWANKDKPSNGRIAWLLWGGDPGRKWATKLRNEMKRGKKSSKKKRFAYRV